MKALEVETPIIQGGDDGFVTVVASPLIRFAVGALLDVIRDLIRRTVCFA